MQITINPKLVSALEAEAIIAKRTSEEYVEMIMNSHLTEKQKNRLFEKVMFIGVEKCGTDSKSNSRTKTSRNRCRTRSGTTSNFI